MSGPSRRQRTGQLFRCVLAFLLSLSPFSRHPVAAQAPADSAWDVTKPRGQTRVIDFTTAEGTWTALDVSPDGTWVVFDLLGQIYRMPIGGGTAVCLTEDSGIAINVHPRISPDGKSVAFVSDRKGQMNVWTMDADGKNAKPVLLDPKSEFRWPGWADTQFIVALKVSPFGPQSLVMLHRDGGQGIELLKGEVGGNPSRPTVSPDGRFVYYDVLTSRPTGAWGRDDALQGSIQVRRLDLKTGQVRPITAGEAGPQGNADRNSSGGAYAAEPSPDGRWLAFMRKVPGGTLNYKGQRYGPRSAMWIRDLDSGGERLLMDPMEMDLSEESFPGNGSYPLYRWTPDGKSIVVHQGGKIRRVEVTTGQVGTVPFSVRVHRVISEQAWSKNRVPMGPVEAPFLRWPAVSPDGRTAAFQALGKIWLMDLPNGPMRRLTPVSFGPFEFQPAWSPDGRSIAFTSWHDTERGALWVVNVQGGEPRRVTRLAGEYLNPAWSQDGRELVVARGAGATARGQTMVRNAFFDIVRVPSSGGDELAVAQVSHDPVGVSRPPEIPRPTVGEDGRIYFTEPKLFPGGGEGGLPNLGVTVVSVRPDGSDRRTHVQIVKGGSALVSPDGRWVALTQGNNVYLAPLPLGGAAGNVPVVDRRAGPFPTTTLSAEGGLHPRWRSAGVVDFVSGNRLVSYQLATGRADTVIVRTAADRDIGRGTIALTGARIVTLDNQRVIPGGTVVVKDGRISCVGRCGTAGADRVVNASGKTIIPGWIDMHAHLHHEHAGMLPARNFETAVYLAYGVTTTFDPSIFSSDPFASADLVETGQMIGPRIFSAGEAITAGDDIATNEVTSLEQALQEVGRRKSWGSPMTKQYNQPTRQQRQWVVEAVRRLGMRTTAEGSGDMYHKLGMVMDGHTGGEHMTVQAPLYSDFLTFLAKARYVYSHTPLVSGYGAWSEEYFWQESPVWQNPKLQQWMPWRQLIPHTRRFIMRPETDYSKDIVAQTVADLVSLGGYSAVGSHGQQHGLGSHWDVWMLAKAAGPMTALEVASMHGATFLGMDQDLGSIAVGKLGDLMVLNGNPLENIRNTANIQFVMKAGVLYEATSLDQVWPRSVKFGDYYWQNPAMFRIDEKRLDAWDRRP